MPIKEIPKSSPAGTVAQGLVERALESEAFAAALKIRPMVLEHVALEAFPFAAAVIAHALPEKRLWMVCENARTQEQMHGDLAVWGFRAAFFQRLSSLEQKDDLIDPDTQAERLSHLLRFAENKTRMLVVCADSLDDEVPDERDLKSQGKPLQIGVRLDWEPFLTELDAAGYERTPTVTERGQFARRGGIVDVFSWNAEQPLRIELLDDQIESLREFDLNTQASVRHLDQVSVLIPQQDASTARVRLRELIQPKDFVVAVECDTGTTAAQARITRGAREEGGEEDFSAAIFENPLGVFHAA
jgi:transcription-repair coupling factor (superfamily II helicase)